MTRNVPGVPARDAVVRLGLAVITAVSASACGDATPTSLPRSAEVAIAIPTSVTASALSSAPWSAWRSPSGGAVVQANGTGSFASMRYELGYPYSYGTWRFMTVASESGTMSLAWYWVGIHSWYQAFASIRPVIYRNGWYIYPTGILRSGGVSGGFNWNGTVTFTVQAGDEYGFELNGSHYDSSYLLAGELTVTAAPPPPPPPPDDNTPPAVVASVTGTQGTNGWYTSDVGISWSVTDGESAVTSSTGCGASSLTSDSNGASYTCSATSSGGTTSQSVTVTRDATPPGITFAGNAGTYTADQQVAITCAATDATSGIAVSSCPGASGTAYTFGPGTQTLVASASDNAGNAATASTQFTVSVTPAALTVLVNRWVSQKGVANAMAAQLRSGAYEAFRNHLRAQSGKSISAANAAILISLSQSL